MHASAYSCCIVTHYNYSLNFDSTPKRSPAMLSCIMEEHRAEFNRNPLFLFRLRSERALKRNKLDFDSPLSLPLSFSWKSHFLWGGVITEEHALRFPLHHKSSLLLELAKEKWTVGYKMNHAFCSIYLKNIIYYLFTIY